LATQTPFDYYFYLLGSFDDTVVIQYATDWIYGIGTGGSVDFRFFRGGTELMDRPTFLGRDPDHVLWFVSGSARYHRDTVYALFLTTNKLVALTESVENAFQAPSGFIYARMGRNLVQLRSIPNVQARYNRGPIPLRAGEIFGMSDIAVSRTGPDGSAWASTPEQVIHEHPNGQVNVIGLSRWPSTITHPPVPLELQVAPDGSAWIARYDKLIRITKEDRVEVMSFPGLGFYPEIHISPDATLWLKRTDDASAVLHIAPPRDP
jgi:hypothetical protein